MQLSKEPKSTRICKSKMKVYCFQAKLVTDTADSSLHFNYIQQILVSAAVDVANQKMCVLQGFAVLQRSSFAFFLS